MRFNELTRLNAVRAFIAAKAMDFAPALGQRWIGSFARMIPAAGVLADSDALAEFARQSVSGTGHLCGTCKMGRPDDAQAVVDPAGRVIGVAGLRVADASVMPLIPSAGMHIPTVMVAEKMAATILSAERMPTGRAKKDEARIV
jgi:5-(hydroxymethyl)furfural/furfural oxidase